MSEPKSNIDYLHMANEQLKIITKLRADLEKCKEALVFYADDNSYKSKYGGHIENKNFHSDIGRDCGKIARQTLKSLGEE